MVIGIALVIVTLGVGALCLLVCRLTVDALPAFAGCAAGFWAYGTGAGPIGALAIGVVGAAVTSPQGDLRLILRVAPSHAPVSLSYLPRRLPTSHTM
jgi:hypothetical protein